LTTPSLASCSEVLFRLFLVVEKSEKNRLKKFIPLGLTKKLIFHIPQLLLLVDCLKLFFPAAYGGLRELLSLPQGSSEFNVPVFTLVAAQGPVDGFPVLYIDNNHK
jgi:hypothetical protein